MTDVFVLQPRVCQRASGEPLAVSLIRASKGNYSPGKIVGAVHIALFPRGDIGVSLTLDVGQLISAYHFVLE